MKNLNIISILITAVFIAVIFYFFDKCDTARSYDFWRNERMAPTVSFHAGLASLPFIVFNIFIFLFNPIKVNTSTSKTINIIGLCLSAALMFWDIMMLQSPTHISFDEVFWAWLIYAFIMMGFHITYLYLGARKNLFIVDDNPEILDDIT